MENNLEFLKEFISDGLIIDDKSGGSFKIFTIRTQHFNVNSLSELTYDRFVQEEINEKVSREYESLLLEEFNKRFLDDVGKSILEEFLNKVD